MRNLVVEAVVCLNRLLPRANVGGRESDDAYSQWEYDVGRSVFEEHFGRDKLDGAHVLDVGCGMGGKTVWYAESGAARVVGLDLERRHVLQSRRFATARGVAERVDIVHGDAMRLPFADASFSVMTANDSMEHFADPSAALREFGRVLRPQGRLFLYFTPWRSPLGSHLYDHVKIPWCQLLPKSVLYPTLERAVRDAERAQGGEDVETRAATRYRDIVEYYENCINGITVGRFHEIVAMEPAFRCRDVHYVVPKFRMLQPLARVPGLREYVSGLVFADLERVGV